MAHQRPISAAAKILEVAAEISRDNLGAPNHDVLPDLGSNEARQEIHLYVLGPTLAGEDIGNPLTTSVLGRQRRRSTISQPNGDLAAISRRGGQQNLGHRRRYGGRGGDMAAAAGNAGRGPTLRGECLVRVGYRGRVRY